MVYPILDLIQDRNDLLALTPEQDKQLCQDIRQFLLDSVSRTGGHLASNLGVVELTVAIHKVFDTSVDRLVFDVGHQSYVHKLLTGRRGEFSTLRQLDGLSGFPKPKESVHDAAIAGHASSSVSVALGLARARTLCGQTHQVLALLGDGALTGGLAYEGLNDAGASGEPLIVILNDNGMSIAPNVGGMAKNLARIRLKPGYYAIKHAYRRLTQKLPGGRYLYQFTHRVKKRLRRAMLGSTVFEEMGFTYLGPVDGHDVARLTEILQIARDLAEPVLVHVRTVKGKGYPPAEENPDIFHGVGKFDATTGKVEAGTGTGFSKAFGQALMGLAGEDERICAITAAMPSGTGLSGFAEAYPDRFFDVGIAEEHAAAMAAGLARGGMLPVFAVYSTFLQRSYDQLIHDVAISGEHVVFAVDRAGLAGADGETHHGSFDVGFLRQVPGLTVFCPADNAELEDMLRRALYECTGPVAIRYPRGNGDRSAPMAEKLPAGRDVTLVTYGPLIWNALDAADRLGSAGLRADVIRLSCIQPLDLAAVRSSYAKTGLMIVVEDCVENGCVGQALCQALQGLPGRMILKNHGQQFVCQGTVSQLHERLGLDGAGIARTVLEAKGETV